MWLDDRGKLCLLEYILLFIRARKGTVIAGGASGLGRVRDLSVAALVQHDALASLNGSYN